MPLSSRPPHDPRPGGLHVTPVLWSSRQDPEPTRARTPSGRRPGHDTDRPGISRNRGSVVPLRAGSANTVTSTFYQRNPDDSAVLFFTEDALPARPILGALNLVTGLGVSAARLLVVGVDRGETLWAGLRGMFFSLPELVFFSIRKDSVPYAPRRLGPASDSAGR